MATEGGFRIHVVDQHPAAANAVASVQPRGVAQRIAPDRGLSSRSRTPATAAEDPLLASTRLSSRGTTPPRIWRVAITAEAANGQVEQERADAFQVALHEPAARVRTVSASTDECRFSVDLTVHGDSIMAAILHGIEHLQAAALSSAVAPLTVVGITALDTGTDVRPDDETTSRRHPTEPQP